LRIKEASEGQEETDKKKTQTACLTDGRIKDRKKKIKMRFDAWG